jgi:hypothetical protein
MGHTLQWFVFFFVFFIHVGWNLINVFILELQLVRIDAGGISLIRQGRNHARTRIIPCPDQPSAQWLLNRIETMFGASASVDYY